MGCFYERRTTGLLHLAVAMLPLALLVACGGGGGGGGTARVTLETPPSPLFDPEEVQNVRALVGGGGPPNGEPEPSLFETRVAEIVGMSDALLFSEVANTSDLSRMVMCNPGQSMCDVIININDEASSEQQEPGRIIGPVLFNGGGNLTGYNDSYSFVTTDGKASGDLIPLVQVSAAGRNPASGGARFEYLGYGGWLANSIFIVQQSAMAGSDMFSTSAAYSFGEANRNNPAANATWNGVMVGTAKDDGDIIQGDARIRFVMNTPNTVAVEFMNIKNIHDNGDATPTAMNWPSVSVQNGAFNSTPEMTGFISGRFYGDGHEEVGGIFDRSNIIGAFGGMK